MLNTRKKPKSPKTIKQTNNLRYRNNGKLLHVATWVSLTDTILSEKVQTPKNRYFIIASMSFSKMKINYHERIQQSGYLFCQNEDWIGL